MFEFIPVVLKNMFNRPATRNYPKVVREPFEKSKGQIAIDLPACIYCGMCSRKCPVGAIEVRRADKLWSIDRFQCITCNACVESCPKKCLSMSTQRPPVALRKTRDVFQMPPQPAPEKPAADSGENHGA